MFAVWPNPVTDKLYISLGATHATKTIISLHDSKAVIVKKQEAFVLPGTNQLHVQMDHLANGIYHISMEWNDGAMKKTIAIVKQ